MKQVDFILAIWISKHLVRENFPCCFCFWWLCSPFRSEQVSL